MFTVSDFRLAVRALRRDWVVNAIAVASLALALAGNTTVFSMVNAVLYRPLPYPEPERLVLVGEREMGAPQTLTAAPANFLDWRERNRAFGQLVGFAPVGMTVGREARPVSVPGARVSPNFFRVLGANMLRGRAFDAAEGEAGRDSVVVVTDEFLASHLPELGDPVGQMLLVDNRERTIIGVLPADFEFILPGLQVWLPLALDPGTASRDERSMFVIGRLRPGLGMEQVREDMERVWAGMIDQHPESNRGYVLDVLNFRYEIPNARARSLFGLVQGAVAFVLLIACLNIANLLAARGHRRQREIALRWSLGARPWHIVRQLLAESLLLTSVAGTLGMLGAYVGVRVIGSRFAGAIARLYTPGLDLPVLLFSVAITVLAALLFGLLPARQALRVDAAETLREGGRGMGSGARKVLSRGLVVAEIALALVLLAGAAMMVQGFVSLRDADPGFDHRNLLTSAVTLPVEGARERLDLLEEIHDAAARLGETKAVTLATALPLSAVATSDTFDIIGRPAAHGQVHPRAFWAAVDVDYFVTLGIPLIRGRLFNASDREGTTAVAVVNQAIVRAHFPGQDPLGERLVFRGREWEIVGVTGDTRQSLVGTDIAKPAGDPVIFLPLSQQVPGTVFLMVRTGPNPLAAAAPLRALLEPLHPRLVMAPARTLEELTDQQWVGMDITIDVLRGFGYLALVLAALGTYGVLAYNVAQRGGEIAIRLSVGARQSQVVGLILRQGALLGVLGLLLGGPLVFVIVRVLRYALQGVGPVDVTGAFLAGAVLLLAALAASVVPALRAARLDPVVVLRSN